MLHVPMRSRMTYTLEAYDHSLGRISFKKIRRKVGAVVAGATGGVIGLKPKLLGIKSKSGKRWFRVGRVVGIATAVVAAAIVAGPTLMSGASKFGSVVAKLAPKALTKLGPTVASNAMKMMTDKGLSSEEAARQLEAEAGQLVEADTPQQAAQVAQAGVGGMLPIVLIGGVVALFAFGQRR